jgi:hypothetical protein
MRWSMAVALSRFGTLSPFHGIRSSSTDIYPSTATLTFYKSHYSSKYLTFTAVENKKVDETQTLQPTTPQQQATWQRYEPTGTGYPFIAFSNKLAMTGPLFNPGVLHGLDWQQISAKLHNPGSQVAQGALGGANLITAAICKMTGNQPASVCTSAPIKALEPRL